MYVFDLLILRDKLNPSIKDVSTWLICLLSEVENSNKHNEFQAFLPSSQGRPARLWICFQNVCISKEIKNVSISIGICMFLIILIYQNQSIIINCQYFHWKYNFFALMPYRHHYEPERP